MALVDGLRLILQRLTAQSANAAQVHSARMLSSSAVLARYHAPMAPPSRPEDGELKAFIAFF